MELAHTIYMKNKILPSPMAFYIKLEISWIEKHCHNI